MTIKSIHLSSLCLDNIEIIFENLSMLDSKVLKNVITTKKLGIVQIVHNSVIINTQEKCITIVGYKMNNSKYIVNTEGRGDTFTLSYKHSDEYMLKAIQNLNNAYTDYVLSNSFNEF